MQEPKDLNGTAQNLIRRIWGLFRLDDPQAGTIKAPDMIESLEKARRDWHYAKTYFNCVSDPDLIDHAIFYMSATEKKYVYLLKKAREKGINIDCFSFADKVG